jgi:hypothetical protein
MVACPQNETSSSGLKVANVEGRSLPYGEDRFGIPHVGSDLEHDSFGRKGLPNPNASGVPTWTGHSRMLTDGERARHSRLSSSEGGLSLSAFSLDPHGRVQEKPLLRIDSSAYRPQCDLHILPDMRYLVDL